MPSFCDLSTPAGRRTWARAILRLNTEEQWTHLCWELFAHQLGRIPEFKRLAYADGRSPAQLGAWKETPAVPQALFKRANLYGAGLPKPIVIYETSGTTTGQPGRQHLASTDIYRAVSVEGARRIGLFEKLDFLHFLVPSPTAAPHSSLSAMFGFWREKIGVSRTRFWVHDHAIDFTELRKMLVSQSKGGKRIGLAGTAFSFVHLLDAWADLPPLRLPRGSWLLETGGFKGRSREVGKAELYAQLARTFSVRDDDIYNEYGMSELSSQAYTRGTRGRHEVPPWARVLVVDPATGREVRVGAKGLVRWIDLANVDSVLALQTLDVAERTPAGFRLIGRLPRTEPRGCSLSAEDLNGASSVSEVAAAVPAVGALTTAVSAKAAKSKVLDRASTFLTRPSLMRESMRPPMRTRRLPLRVELLARAFPRLFPRRELLQLIREQLGSVDALESGRVRAPGMIHHICAGNLAVSAFTSLMHGLLLGSHNVVKLPGDREDDSTRREILAFIQGLPTPLRKLVETQTALDLDTLQNADAVIAYGSDATMDAIRARLRWDQKFIPHGHAVSLLWIAEPNRLTPRQARACATDVLTYDQLGCLSPQAIYVPPGTDVEALGHKLSHALEAVNGSRRTPCDGLVDARNHGSQRSLRTEYANYRQTRPLVTAAKIAEARDLAFALGHRVWLPPTKHLGWTVIHDPDPLFAPSPLHGVIFIRKAGETQIARALAPVAGRISTVGVVGEISSRLRESFLSLGVSRFCAAGRMQFPPLTWHHDGRATLAELVTRVDFEAGG